MTKKTGFRVLFSPEEIDARNREIARQIADAKFENLLIVGILTGCFVFMADLVRALGDLDFHPEVEFMRLSSYGRGTETSGAVRIVFDLETDVAGRDVLLVDDILDTGLTLAFARDLMQRRGAGRVATTVLLDKPARRMASIAPDFRGFECPDVFVVGYGIDMAHHHRELRFVGEVVANEANDGKA